MKIKKLVIENFRGINFLELNLNGKNILIEGKNGEGKTSVVNAFTWLLFNKIFDGNQEITKFEIQNINKKEQDTAVECEFMDGTILKKINKLKVTKKRGTLETIIDGNTNEYFVNDVSKTMKAYNEFISSIIDEKLFKLLSNPMYFNTLSWDKKRDLIMNLVPIAENHQSLKEMYEQIASIKATCKKTKDKIEELDTRIKENLLKKQDVKFDEKSINEIQEQIKVLEDKKNNIAKDIAEKTKEYYASIANFETLIAENNSLIKKSESLKTEKQYEIAVINGIKDSIEQIELLIVQYEKNKTELENEIQDLRLQHKDAQLLQFKINENDTKCKVCGNYLPEELSNDAITKMEKKFNEDRKQLLDNINFNGQNVKGRIEKLNDKIKEEKNRIINNENRIIEKQKLINSMNNDINVEKLEKEIRDYEERNEELTCMALKIEVNEEIARIELDIDDLKEELNVELKRKFEFEQQIKLQSRIEELEVDKKQQSSLFFEKQAELINIEQIVKHTVDKTVDNVTKLFPPEISFKLFEEQKNGGIQETFDIMFEGRAYNLPISSGEKIFVGLELIKVLQKKYDVELPIFIDNYESLTKEINIENQLICLKVLDVPLTIGYDINTNMPKSYYKEIKVNE